MPDKLKNPDCHKKQKTLVQAMDKERNDWFFHWRELSDYYLPRRYPWLRTQKEIRSADRKNTKLLDSTSTLAVRTLASGLMNGITSPARPWFRLRIDGVQEESLSYDTRLWIEEVNKIVARLLAESNFYNAVAVLYVEWCTFGTASMACYEDYDSVIRFYNYSLGEFYVTQDSSQRIDRHARRFVRTVSQMVDQFGIENVCENTRRQYEKGGASLMNDVEVIHLIEANNAEDKLIYADAPYRECYWEVAADDGKYLSTSPLYEWPTSTPRWEVQGNDSYGTSPAMDALADTKQLQKILLDRAKALSKQVSPPMILDPQLRNRPKALGAGGITYSSSIGPNRGAVPLMQIQIPYGELANDINALQARIREACHNNLFNMISQLETVRSATEIDARREEKLVHLGPVLQRFYNEGLDPILRRVYGIAKRAGVLPEAPEELKGTKLDVQYVSILTDAQRASGTVTTERFLQFAGSLAGVYPETKHIPNVEELVRQYADDLGMPTKSLKSREEAQELLEAENAQMQMAQSAAVGKDLAQGAKVLSDSDVGGGQNALQQLLG